MLLSSLNRLYRFLGDENGNLNESTENNRILLDWLTAVSSRVEKYLNRTIQISTYTEYSDFAIDKIRYPVKAVPVSSITSVKVDSEGLFDGSETTLSTDEYYISSNQRSIVLVNPEPYRTERGIQIVYTGGLAYHAVNTVLTYTGLSGTLSVGDYVKGATSKSVGIVNTAPASDSVTIENLYGVIEAGEVIWKTDTEDGATGQGSDYFTVSSIDRQSLNESSPDLVRAVEMELRYMKKHKFDFEVTSSGVDGGTSRRSTGAKRYGLQPEVIAMLDSYKRLNYL